MRTLSSLTTKHLSGKSCLLRSSLNIANLREDFRLAEALASIRFLSKKGAITLVVGHRGRPKSVVQKDSLRLVLPYLRKHLKQRVHFFDRLDIPTITKKLRKAKPGSIFLLENLRFHKGEYTNSDVFAKHLASLAHLYINDAFPVSHREQSSVVAITRHLPSFAGLQLTDEVSHLSRVTHHPKKPLVVILGGAKISDKLGVIHNFERSASSFLIGGATANVFLKARGLDIGNSLYEKDMLPTAKKLIQSKKVFIPQDVITERQMFLDIGPFTIQDYLDKIAHAKTIIWSGPLGCFERQYFRAGSTAIAKAIARSKAFSIAGGGETTEFIFELGLQKRFGFLSTGGGAMLAFLAGKKLPGLVALERSKLKL
ncbi:MAG: phosphoglycerate kinase [Candidatus Harrisonbacteria bacterium CG10_big_fil_rev_8_21_14_0_10_42_17]|uniref:Phosphoglycerate kinase n=1 Tax=Candidatus Harrisonbacteria bacterium CG10_big_fil_rev_8_21_14_0_10_42_17 TaxID=1974584 RepID=A0A2M6WH92_9BACT|nr:MAG: phosphoglycerate kinase [Candidatus Harrisonbacteria bacterium CG10_big_fil_rev_8_21_14_0_10_42_17]